MKEEEANSVTDKPSTTNESKNVNDSENVPASTASQLNAGQQPVSTVTTRGYEPNNPALLDESENATHSSITGTVQHPSSSVFDSDCYAKELTTSQGNPGVTVAIVYN